MANSESIDKLRHGLVIFLGGALWQVLKEAVIKPPANKDTL